MRYRKDIASFILVRLTQYVLPFFATLDKYTLAMSQQMVDKYYYVLTRKTQERQVFL